MRPLVALVVVLGACDAYDHDVGPAPFLCGTGAQRCPVDYDCIEDPNSGDEICVKSGSTSSAVDCNDDSAIEPNDTLAKATSISGSTFSRDSLAICPPTDRDTFAVPLAGATAIELEVVLESSATLRAEILNAGGVPIAAASLGADLRTLSAVADGLAAGSYFARVSSPTGRANNYSITIRTR